MRCASIGSGSKGNALVVSHNDTAILIDCGFPLKHLKAGLARLEMSVEDIAAVFITHEHGDHIRGLKAFHRHSEAQVYMSAGTAEASNNVSLARLNTISGEEMISVGELQVLPVTVPHDAREPYQFIIRASRGRAKSDYASLGVLTDLGSIPPHVHDNYSCCDALIIEANHDELMLREGAYPFPLKKRVGGNWGHLSNRQTSEFLAALDRDRLQWAVVAHISEQNNCLEKLALEIDSRIENGIDIHYAAQDMGFDWLAVE